MRIGKTLLALAVFLVVPVLLMACQDDKKETANPTADGQTSPLVLAIYNNEIVNALSFDIIYPLKS